MEPDEVNDTQEDAIVDGKYEEPEQDELENAIATPLELGEFDIITMEFKKMRQK